MPISWSRLAVALVILAAIATFFALGGDQYLTLDYLKSQQAAFQAYFETNPMTALLGFGVIYVLVTALSFPGAAVLTLAAGALFGVVWGTILVSFASTIGATLAFLAARWLIGETLQEKYKHKLKRMHEGVKKEGAFYLFTLRLVPVFPFFLINLLMALTPIRAITFFVVSQIGMLPGTLAYVYAGTELGEIESLSGILSFDILLAFTILGIFPLLAKKCVDWLRAKKVYRGFSRPKRYDYNLIVIGAGSAGLVTSYIAAAIHAKVALIEKNKMGGDCLNTGCVPSKALIRSAKMAHYQRHGDHYGLHAQEPDIDFARIMDRVQEIIKRIEPHDSVERYEKLGVECIAGDATIKDPWRVEVNGKILTTRNIVIATGAEPLVPPIPGLEDVHYVTSDNVWELREKPQRMVVLGGGPIGCELSQAFARLGVQVTQVEKAPQLLGREDDSVIAQMETRFVEEGITLLTGHEATGFEKRGDEQMLICQSGGDTKEVPFDVALIALGRKPRAKGYGIEALGIALSERGTIATDAFLRTNYPNIYVCGDIAGPYQFTHTAAHQAWYACVNALFSPFKTFRVDYSTIPWVTFTDPEVAHVGLNEKQAKEDGIAYEVTSYGLGDLDRAIAEGEAHGQVKVLSKPGKDRILGVTIVGHHAGDMLAEFILAMKHGIGLNKILGTIHPYPTLAEANKFAAGEWKRAHAPQWALTWLERFHRWRRG